MKQLIALFGFFALSLEASVEDHFKPALNKSGAHSIENIDFIYMINLDQRPEKFERCIQQLHPYGVYPYRFSAVNGWELTLEAIQDVGVKFSADMNGGFLATSYLEEDLAIAAQKRGLKTYKSIDVIGPVDIKYIAPVKDVFMKKLQALNCETIFTWRRTRF